MTKEKIECMSEERVQRLCEIKIVCEECCRNELIVPLINSTTFLNIYILDKSTVRNEEVLRACIDLGMESISLNERTPEISPN